MKQQASSPELPNFDLVTTSQAAAALGVKPRTLAAWRCTARSQPLPFLRVGGRVWYYRADVLAYIEAGRQQPAGRR